MRDNKGKLRSQWAADLANIATIPTMILAGALVGYWLGRWVGDTFFPEHRKACITGGVLYGLLTGLYHMYKTIRRVAKTPTEHGNRPRNRTSGSRPPSSAPSDKPAGPPADNSHDD